jgi:hypothetical protein
MTEFSTADETMSDDGSKESEATSVVHHLIGEAGADKR